MDARLQPGGRRVATPAELRARLLAAAEGLRQGRGAPRDEVAREVQLRGPPHLGGAGLREPARTPARSGRARLPWDVGERAVPVALRAGRGRTLVAAADARVVPGHRPTRRA